MRMTGRLRRVRYLAHALMLVALVWLIIGANTTSTAAADTQITIQGFAFSPAAISVPVGTTVTWTNKDAVGHDVTSTNGPFASKTLATGQSFSYTFNQAGSFTYTCTIHPRMVATINVTGSVSAGVLPQTGHAQDQRNWGTIAALVAAVAVIAGGAFLRARSGRTPEGIQGA
jgi:plastocyanin